VFDGRIGAFCRFSASRRQPLIPASTINRSFQRTAINRSFPRKRESRMILALRFYLLDSRFRGNERK
jgi:hypothetical protein